MIHFTSCEYVPAGHVQPRQSLQPVASHLMMFSWLFSSWRNMISRNVRCKCTNDNS